MSSLGQIGDGETLPSLSLLPSMNIGEDDTPITESFQPRTIVRRVGEPTRIPPAETNLAELTFDSLDLMPVRCYSCAKVIRQRAIQDSLNSGKTLLQTFQELNYRKLCCRKLIQSQRSIVKLQKQIEHNLHIGNAFDRGLTLETTSSSTFSIGPSSTTSTLRILDELPPQFNTEYISMGGIGESIVQIDDGLLNPYNYVLQGLVPDEADYED
jgi:DNA-directed RNA polymerase subunit N (RpoN/RPB10)